jgi:iron complex transport system substrate-binding protein
MTRPRLIGVLNGSAVVLAVVLSLLAAGRGREGRVRVAQVNPTVQTIEAVTLPDGREALRDAGGAVVPLQRYARIASVSLVADHVLSALCEPERVIAVTGRSKRSPRFGYLHAARASIETLEDLEGILALEPDLLITNHFGDPRYAARLRERGVTLFDLGEMHGMETLIPNIHTIAALIGAPERGARMAARLQRRMAAIARDIPLEGRPSGLFVSKYGKQLFGGTRRTSYHDVIVAAGLRDAAAERYEGWPSLDAEQVLALDPDVLITKEGMGEVICEHPGMQTLRACGAGGRVVELDIHLVDDPGPPMLEMAEALRRAVHGP